MVLLKNKDGMNYMLREPVILIGLDSGEEADVIRSIDETDTFKVVGSYQTYSDALEILNNIRIGFAILSCRLDDMTITDFVKTANAQYDMYTAFLIPVGYTNSDVSYLAIEGINSGKVVNFMRAPATRDQIKLVSKDLAYYRCRDQSKSLLQSIFS